MNKWWRLSFHIGGSFSQCFFPPNYSLLEFLPAFKGHSSLQCHHSLIALTNSELALSLFQNAHCLETSSAMAIWLVTENHAVITLALFKLRWANISTQNLLNSYTSQITFTFNSRLYRLWLKLGTNVVAILTYLKHVFYCIWPLESKEVYIQHTCLCCLSFSWKTSFRLLWGSMALARATTPLLMAWEFILCCLINSALWCSLLSLSSRDFLHCVGGGSEVREIRNSSNCNNPIGHKYSNILGMVQNKKPFLGLLL